MSLNTTTVDRAGVPEDGILDLDVQLTNNSNVSITDDVELSVDGKVVGSTEFTVGGGETDNVTLTFDSKGYEDEETLLVSTPYSSDTLLVSIGMPDSGIYLQDGWGDGKLTDREDSNTHDQTVGTTTYTTTYRPQWAVQTETVSASRNEDGYMQVEEDARVKTPSNFNEDDFKVYWRWEFTSNTDSSLRRRTSGFLGDATYRNSGNGWMWTVNPDSGSGETFTLSKVEGGESTRVIDESWTGDTEIHETEVIRQNGEDWELKLDGSTVGTAKDGTDFNAELITFGGGNGTAPWRIHDFQIGKIDYVPVSE